MNSVRDREAKSERPKRIRRHEVLSRRAARTLVGLVALILLPLIALVIAFTETAGPDLFDLTPVVGAFGSVLDSGLAGPGTRQTRVAHRLDLFGRDDTRSRLHDGR